MCPESGLGGPECCLRISLLPLRLNIDQVTACSTFTLRDVRHQTAADDLPCLTALFILFPVQDALFFLKDFFSNLASFVNPYLPVDAATEGELCLIGNINSVKLVPWSYCM